MLGMFKAMRTTIRHLPMKKITVQYPEQRERLPERSRGLFRVVIDPANGEPRCRACTLCESNCPAQVIRVNYTSKYQLPVPNAARIAEARLAAQPEVDLKPLQPVLDDYYERGTGLIAILQNAQEAYGYLPRLAIQEISLQTGVSLSQIYGVTSFYNQFRLSPAGKHIITVCHGTACHVTGRAVADGDDVLARRREAELVVEAGDAVDLRQRHAGLQRYLLDRETRQIPVGLLRVLQYGDEAGAALVVVVEHRLQRLEVDFGLRGEARLGDARRVGYGQLVLARVVDADDLRGAVALAERAGAAARFAVGRVDDHAEE